MTTKTRNQKTQTQKNQNQTSDQDAKALAEQLGIQDESEEQTTPPVDSTDESKENDSSQDESKETEGSKEEPKEPEGDAETPEDAAKAQFETILPHLTEKHQAFLRKTAESDLGEALDIAKDMFKMQFPNGLAESFKTRLQADLPSMISKLAEEYMIDLTAQKVTVTFPEGEEAIASFGSLIETVTGKGKKKGNGESWGDCTKTVVDKDGKESVMGFETPSAMAKNLGLRITGHADSVHVFTHPTKAEGLDHERNWTGKKIELISGDVNNKSAGIHVRVS